MSDGYTTFEVPANQAGRARMVLRQQDLPTSYGFAPGWELLDTESIWTSPQRHEDMVQRAVQGELQRMLNELDFVKRSFVFVHFAEEAIFLDEQQPSEAAITLDVVRRPTQEEIEAVLGIVSTFGGVHLTRDHITVATTDPDIPVLHSPMQDEMARIASTKAEIVEQWERKREQKVREAFARLGRDVSVTVSAKLSFASQEIIEESVSKGAPLSEAKTESTLTTTESLPEGPPGTFSSLPEGVPGPTQTQTRETTEETISNMQPGRTQKRTTIEPGDVEGYKVSVAVDWGERPMLGDDGEPTGEMEYGPPTAEELLDFQQMVANTVGTDVQLGDVHVFAQPFQLDQLRQAREAFRALEWAKWQEVARNYGVQTVVAVLILGLFLYVRRELLRVIAPPEVEEEAEEEVEAVGPTADELRRQQMASEVEQLATEQPDAVAALIRAWMSEAEE
jgi:flagellar M-ring protein FliF